MNYSDDEIIKILILRRRRKRRRKKIIRRLILLALIFFLMVFLIFSLISHVVSGDQASKKPAKSAGAVKTRSVIFIDPGHGGNDPGAEYGNRIEKEDTLKLGLALRKTLEKEHFKVVMSRDSDSSVERDKRAEMANESGAVFMISIHRNKANTGKGVEIWIPSGDPSPDRLLAENIMQSLEKKGISQNRGVRSGTLVDESDDYPENSGSSMPSCLIEFGFVNNDVDNMQFDTNLNAYAEKMAEAVSKTYSSLYDGKS